VLFAQAIMQGKPIRMFNHGNMQRDFTYIDDVAEGTLKVLSHVPSGSPRGRFSISGIINRLRCPTTSRPSKRRSAGKRDRAAPMQPGDVPATYADVERLARATGFLRLLRSMPASLNSPPGSSATTAMPETLVPVILCGGSGSRLWPMSRQLLPKQFLPLVTEHTLLQDTMLRLRGSRVAAHPSRCSIKSTVFSPRSSCKRSASIRARCC
jgi:hypothetical protein